LGTGRLWGFRFRHKRVSCKVLLASLLRVRCRGVQITLRTSGQVPRPALNFLLNSESKIVRYLHFTFVILYLSFVIYSLLYSLLNDTINDKCKMKGNYTSKPPLGPYTLRSFHLPWRNSSMATTAKIDSAIVIARKTPFASRLVQLASVYASGICSNQKQMRLMIVGV
jgi:hypothetical protein